MGAVTDLPASIQALWSRAPPDLTPKHPYDATLRKQIDGLAEAPPCVRASLHLLNDDIDRAHEVAQADEDCDTSNMAHAILHRREADYWNSKYWIRRIGSHPVMDVHDGAKGASRFVDDVERSETSKGPGKHDEALRALQFKEMRTLAEHALKEHK